MWLRHVRVLSLRAGHAVALILCLMGTACTTAPEDPVARQAYRQINDPLEPFNRSVFHVNLMLDDAVLAPTVGFYNRESPMPIRNGIRNALWNLRLPTTFANSLLQADFANAANAFVAFSINTVFGLGGVLDVAGELVRRPRAEDFGQTLGRWGVEEGPYIQLPLVGPSNVRDLVGLGVDVFAEPLTYVAPAGVTPLVGQMRAFQVRADLDADQRAFRATSVDSYAGLRSLYRQRREADIRNIGNGDDAIDLDVFDDVPMEAGP